MALTLLALLTENGVDETARTAVLRSQEAFASESDELRAAIATVQERCAQSLQLLDQGGRLNSLGVLNDIADGVNALSVKVSRRQRALEVALDDALPAAAQFEARELAFAAETPALTFA